MKKLLTLLAFVGWVVGFAACSSDNDDPESTPVTPTLSISSPTSGVLNFAAAGETQNIQFTASTNWTVSVSGTGFSANTTSGPAGTQTVSITATENTNTSSRSGSVSITCGTSSTGLVAKFISLSQKAAEAPVSAFVKGADISWVTEMEQASIPFYDANGEKKDCFELMKSLGMNLIRLRVWVNPENTYGKWCDKDDVVAKAVRAKNAGLDVMIDFHYSDVFADPSNQAKPAAWKDLELSDLKNKVAEHTTEVLTALKEKSVEPKYIQIGNETRNGMLWPTGQLWNDSGDLADGWKNYATLSNAGYDAAKAVFADAAVLVHQNNAYEDLDWWFSKFKDAGGKFDMIGLSHYPQEAYDGDSKMDAEKANNLAVRHVTTLGATYGVKVLVVEIGVKPSESNSVTLITDFVNAVKLISYCEGVVYWEPEYYASESNNWWKPSYYTTVGWECYDKGAFTSEGKPSSILDVFN